MNVECTSTSKVNVSAASKLLNLHKRNFIVAKNRLRAVGDGNLPISLCAPQPMDRGFITPDEKELIFSFWMSNTRVSPNKKDVCRKRIGRKSYVKHPVHLLEQSQVITCFTISIFVF